MKIALLSTPWIKIPPVGYGGTELVVANLAEGLVKRGHDTTVFATKDSQTTAKLAYHYDKAVGNDLSLKQNPFYMLFHIHAFMEFVKREKFDIIHNHLGHMGFFFLDLQENTPFVHTIHGAFYKSLSSPSGLIDSKRDTMLRFKNHPYISISNNQRTGIPELHYVKTVYNGIRTDEFEEGDGSGNYLAWLGRVTPNKGLDIAIHVAKQTGMKLKVSAFVDEGDRKYFEKEIVPLFDEHVEFIGELTNPHDKSEFFGKAAAMLFPIRWHEPFGLVMAESMACGTPVIAMSLGSVPEVVEHGKTGFMVNSEDGMHDAIKKISTIDRKYCRSYAIGKFSIDAMVNGYIEAYNTVIERSKSKQ